MAYTYDAAGRVINLTHTNTANGTLIVGYAATYLNNGQLSKVTESPSGDVTTYSYDPAGNLLNEVRTGQRPYSGAYTYWSDSNRKTADVITNGVTVHNGSYSYDGAGRLDQCIDSATGLTEIYTWNADGTLARMPGPKYTREFTYNEEAQLLVISHSGTLAYQYAYGADGNRRWSKDIANDIWTWYPCGVACGAGEMVEETSTLTGSSWATSGQYLRAGGGCSSLLIRRKSTTDDEYPLINISHTYETIINESTDMLRVNLVGGFNQLLLSSGSAIITDISISIRQDYDNLNFSNIDNAYSCSERSLFLTELKTYKKTYPCVSISVNGKSYPAHKCSSQFIDGFCLGFCTGRHSNLLLCCCSNQSFNKNYKVVAFCSNGDHIMVSMPPKSKTTELI